MKRLANFSNAVGTAVITGTLSIPAFTVGWTLLVGVALSDITILMPLANAAFWRTSQLFTVNTTQSNKRNRKSTVQSTSF